MTTAQVKSVSLVLLVPFDGTDLKIQSRSCLALTRTQMNAPKVADYFRGELVKNSTQDHRAKTRSQRGLEKQSAIVYPAKVSFTFFQFETNAFFLNRYHGIRKLD